MFLAKWWTICQDEDEDEEYMDAVATIPAPRNGAGGSLINGSTMEGVAPLKSCMKQSHQRVEECLREPLLGEQDEEKSRQSSKKHCGEKEEDERDRAATDEVVIEEGDREKEYEEHWKNRKNGERRVQWIDGLGKDIAEVREYEQSDREDDVLGKECKCAIQ